MLNLFGWMSDFSHYIRIWYCLISITFKVFNSLWITLCISHGCWKSKHEIILFMYPLAYILFVCDYHCEFQFKYG
jgi:hypothetical protein